MLRNALTRMNHQYSIRLPLRVSVEVSKRGRFLGRYFTRDMNAESVFIETRMANLNANDILELTFIFPGAEHRDCTLLAVVARIGAEGAGLILIDPEQKALDILGAAA